MSIKSSKTKKSWVSAEEYVPTDEKRKRKKRLSITQKFNEEWNDLANDEAVFKKFKKGKISIKQYNQTLLGLSEKQCNNVENVDDS